MERPHNYRRVMRAFQPIRKRSVTCAEFLSSLRWNLMKNDTKEEWQERCLSAYFDLLFSDDQKVAQAALAGLERVVKNADFTEYSGVFATRIPDDLISLDKDSLPAVLNMPREFRFRGECADFVVESNLEMILYSLIDYFSMDVHGRSGALCSTMDALLKAFPAAVFPECWGCLSKWHCAIQILGVMCELPRDGIIYAMADPKKVLFEAVTTQLYDPGTGNKELLTEIALYLIVLARTNVIKYDQVSRVAVELIEKVAQTNAEEIISAVEVILLEILFAQRMDASIIYAAFRNKSKMLFSLASQRTLLLWTLFLHASRNDESSILYDLLMASIKVSFKADNLLLDYVLFLLQTLVNVFKAVPILITFLQDVTRAVESIRRKHELTVAGMREIIANSIMIMQTKIADATRRRRNFTKEATAILQEYYADHFNHPYPNEKEKLLLAAKCHISLQQVGAQRFYGIRFCINSP
ncbi:hypothetical protein GCK32_010291 [Trichostrongylus colubriformis]|uniref:KN homeodomain domain-containing protein n=1 Tax=Trichostrongylus colubriformis TaxID=6319 RepID=A0AAN8F9Y6_TRICO